MTEHAAHPPEGAHASDIPWREEIVSRLILGTVQLGMPYGVANTQGRPDPAQARTIVEAAWSQGVRHFDTAQAYGESEAVLGRCLRELDIAGQASVTSKLSPALDPTDSEQIAASIERTLDRLGCGRLWCMMLHRPDWLDHWDKGLGGVLLAARKDGRVEHLGVSLIAPEDAPRCLAHPDMEVLQVAASAWDRRMVRRGVLDSAREHGQLCCIRSVYLQGLLTMPPEAVAARLPAAREASERWHALAARFGIPQKELAVRFCTMLAAPLVVGAESPEQVEESARLIRQGPLPAEILNALRDELEPVLNEKVLNPMHW